jgi:hypothetical protein
MIPRREKPKSVPLPVIRPNSNENIAECLAAKRTLASGATPHGSVLDPTGAVVELLDGQPPSDRSAEANRSDFESVRPDDEPDLRRAHRPGDVSVADAPAERALADRLHLSPCLS